MVTYSCHIIMVLRSTHYKMKFYKILLVMLFNFQLIQAHSDYCEKESQICEIENKAYRYILYDINPPEGFNLRRDVYMRLAVLVHNLQNSKDEKLQNFKLVLPPWSDLYHWRSNENNMHIPWSHFFDLNSLQAFAPVIEMYQFFNEVGKNYNQVNIDEVYILQNFEEMFKTGKFEDKISVDPCKENSYINFFEYSNMTSKNIKCLSYHGHASQLTSILANSTSKTFLFHHAEIVLHDRYGDNKYWQARRSMRFSNELRSIANEFRFKYLNSTDKIDNTIIPDDWRNEKPHRGAKGGPYLSVHLRRRDFLRGRPNDVPDLHNTAKQIQQILLKTNLSSVFIATDAPLEEYNTLKEMFPKKYKIFKFFPSKEIYKKHKDGGIAIIEQIICSHAQYFIGTHESTFSFRIQEEREILGFPVDKTFNRLCANDNKKCQKPSVWKIVY